MFRCLYDFTYECDIQEALVFYFFYSIFIGYFIIGMGLAFFEGRFADFVYSISDSWGFVYDHFVVAFLSLIPFLLCSTVSVLIVLKKDLQNPFSVFLVLLTFFLTLIAPNCFSFYVGLIPISILMTMDDNSEKIKLELDGAKRKEIMMARKMEKEIARDRVRELKSKLFKTGKCENEPEE